MPGSESGVGVVSSVLDSKSSSGFSAAMTMPRKNALIALVMQPPMSVIPQSASPSSPLPGWPVPGLVGGAEVGGCGMQPSPVHGGGAGAVDGCVHSYCSEPGKHVTGVLSPVGIGSGTPVGGGVVVGAGT
ncbi:hypothetical protein [Amycolatopsis balhimycina]|uniref:hypothetical protein n=1 Tax=Amycolatopsis balhimycina TaxID=208443 RepID=UPI000378081C|nr:hypothetical protein [Amycolatopsis balhimycina]